MERGWTGYACEPLLAGPTVAGAPVEFSGRYQGLRSLSARVVVYR